MSSTAPQINSRAQAGFANAKSYDQHRPTYSPEHVQYLLEQLGVADKKGATILDLAAGTGKLTEVLASRDEGYKIVAVEPHDDMRQVLAAKQLKGVEVVSGTAENMENVRDGTVDAVVVGQAFHWFATMSALKEIHRVLQSHGALGLIWNIEDYNNSKKHKPSSAWEQTAKDLTWQVSEELGDQEPRFRHLQWKKVFDEQIKMTPLSLIKASDDQLFSLPIAEYHEPWQVALPVDKVWERYRTLGYISVLRDEKLEKTKKTFMDAIGAPDVERDAGNVVVHGNTYLVWTTKIPAEGRESLTGVERPGT
ncbi:uncharacterized protein MYCFIDRAFT_31560 [Pseudocercospora fijiensis CIRAD86]|uniref:Methyltransferase type 11 domain-containing protein n=1 Tax=Pseudocercospora fijiensis (strain CIRAD86) TaxID=383855 RepID=M3AS41_PSEFD|nr:uncharacterized protein MYCFIDRAFT_31560 [Pseudocercospora fijiensis CIRAD86]EME80282.1 hypothetical protein MYCFIDRAFT_31560 [Pseudocercospora fijiensis CIRAD86]